ncbi:MAG TPA: ATP12 family protein [Stellaceae bacterium]|nr:ATP12 family protein [Stellaceae bacterium]
MKRFYTAVAVTEDADGFGVALDGKPLRTPAKHRLILPNIGLAEAIAAEWQAQEETIKPERMPLTRLASTAIDRVAVLRGPVIEEAVGYAGSDLVCYRADTSPELAAREAASWQPLIDWLMLRFDAPLVVTSGIVPVAQPPETLEALRGVLRTLDDFTLTAVTVLTANCGSLVLSLALLDQRISAGDAFDLATLDETFQIERWGEDAEATKRLRHVAAEIEDTSHFLALLR